MLKLVNYKVDLQILINGHEDDEIGNGAVYDWGCEGGIAMATHADSMYTPDFTDAQKAQYKGVYLSYTTVNNVATKSPVKVNTEGEFARIVRFRFMASVDTALNKDVFFLTEHPSFTNIYIDPNDEPLGNLKGQVLPTLVSNLTIEYPAGGSSAPTVTVNTLEAQVQWADKDAGTMNLGFRGQLVGFDVEAQKDGTTGPNGGANLKDDTLKEVGIILTKGTGTGTKYSVHTVYNFKDGGYFYRLVVGNVSYTSTEEFSAKAYVVIGSDTFEASNAITTTGAAQYERAKDAMGAK